MKHGHLTLSCGHSYVGFYEKIGGEVACKLGTHLATIVSINDVPLPTVTPRYPARPNVDAILNSTMHMIQECLRINYTGKSFEMVLEETRRNLYDGLDANIGGSPTPKPVDYEAEYLKLYKHLDAIRAILKIAPYPDNGLDAYDVYREVGALVNRCLALQTAAIPAPRPSDGRPWGTDFNGLVHLINNLVKP